MSSSSFEENKYLAIKLNAVFQLKKEKKYQEAEAMLNNLLEEYPKNLLLKRNLADVLTKQGQPGQLAKAILLIDKVLKSSPKDDEAMLIKGQIYYKKGKYSQAKDWLQNALRLKYSSFTLQMLIKAMIKLGITDEASTLAEEALEKGDDISHFLQLKAEILETKDKLDEAMSLYEEILSLEPKNKYILKELIRLKTEKMDRAKAVKEIDSLLRVSTYAQNEHIYTQQAENYKKQGKYAQAIEAYLKGLTISPDSLFIKKMIGYCYNRLNKYEEVITFMREPFLQEPTDYPLRKTLFSAYKKTGRKEELINLIEEMNLADTPLYYALQNEAKKIILSRSKDGIKD